MDIGVVDIIHCLTEKMLAYFFTKPVQESLFLKFKAILLVHKLISSLYPPYQKLKECI